jgi:ATP/ADP translocase
MFNWIFLASQNIVIYRNTVSEAISPPNLNSNLSINLLLTITLISCIILIVVLYRRIHQNNLKSQMLVQNLQQRVEVLEIKFIDADG